MNRVFLGGSRKISRLNEPIRTRLEEIVRRGMAVLIGDANGADKAMQRQLAALQYPHVTVYFVGSAPRNNEGAWETHRVETPPGARGFDFYSAKDRVMAEAAECGLMLWDGDSRGTLANVENLTKGGKPVAVYVGPRQRFINVRSEADMNVLIAGAFSGTELPGVAAGEAQTALALTGGALSTRVGTRRRMA
jgi:hypothetical protein